MDLSHLEICWDCLEEWKPWALREVPRVNMSAGFVGRSGRDGNCGRVLGCFEDAKRRDEEMAEITG